MRASGRQVVLGGERFARGRGRLGVRHLHEAGDTPGDRRARLAGEVALVGQSRFAEMDLVIDHPRQQPFAARVHHLGAVRCRQAAADLLDAFTGNQDIAMFGASVADDEGIADQNLGHGFELGGAGWTGSLVRTW